MSLSYIFTLPNVYFLLVLGKHPLSISTKNASKTSVSKAFLRKKELKPYITFFSPSDTSTQPPDARADILLSYIASQS
jgi:hypothetical protein